MKRLWNMLAHPALAFWLLILCAFTLSFGSIISRVRADAIKPLNDMLFQYWLPSYVSQPGVYGWIFVVMLLLGLLSLNTVACMVTYVEQTNRAGLWRRRAGIILLHGCFLIFLLGHLLSTFFGCIQSITLKEDQITPVAGTYVQLTAQDIQHVYEFDQNKPVLVRIEALLAMHGAGKSVEQIPVASFEPAFAGGYSFHVVLKDNGQAMNEVGIVVRRDYGLPVLICGALFTLIALGLYGFGLSRR